MTLATLFIICAIVCFFAGFFNAPRFGWLCGGFGFWLLASVVGGVGFLRL